MAVAEEALPVGAGVPQTKCPIPGACSQYWKRRVGSNVTYGQAVPTKLVDTFSSLQIPYLTAT